MSSKQSPALIGLAIRRLRIRQSLTRRQLAKLSGLRESELRLIEEGRQPISGLELAFVSDALGVREEVLLGIEPLPTRDSSGKPLSPSAMEAVKWFDRYVRDSVRMRQMVDELETAAKQNSRRS